MTDPPGKTSTNAFALQCSFRLVELERVSSSTSIALTCRCVCTSFVGILNTLITDTMAIEQF